METPPGAWLPPPELVTQPDQLPGDAWPAVELLDGERVLRCWRAGTTYLLLTNLRCLGIGHHRELFRTSGWEVVVQFFFYDLRPPEVVLGRFLELAEAYPGGERTYRFLVPDAAGVAGEIAAAIPPGRSEWIRRRETEGKRIEARRRQREAYARALAAGIPPEVIRVPCAYCGNPMPIAARRCPSCGAPAG